MKLTSILICSAIIISVTAQNSDIGWKVGRSSVAWVDMTVVNSSWSNAPEILARATVPAALKPMPIGNGSTITLSNPETSYLAFVYSYEQSGQVQSLHVVEYPKPDNMGTAIVHHLWTISGQAPPSYLKLSSTCSFMESSLTHVSSDKKVWIVRFCGYNVTALNVDSMVWTQLANIGAPVENSHTTMSKAAQVIGKYVPIFINTASSNTTASLYM